MRICLVSPGLGRSREEEGSRLRGHDTISWPQGGAREQSRLFPLLPGHLALYLLHYILRACSGLPGIQTFLETLEEEHLSDPVKPSYLHPQYIPSVVDKMLSTF